MTELNDKQRALIGKWELESSENFDEFMKELGLNAALRAIAGKLKPKATLSVEGDVWTIKIETMVKNEVVKFKMGEKFEHKTPIGVALECIAVMDEDGKLTETQEILEGGNKGQKSYVFRYIENDKMVTLLKTGNVEAKRIYTRVKSK